ncbi:hypothetical protein TNCV_3816941 [Trichonephila clavipes]|nr:hypothetical protein TNCV_3816941 [Trichonephila clavipes]
MNLRRLNRRFTFGRLDCKTVPQSHVVRVYDVGHVAKVEFNILLSGITAIGWAMESGRRGYGSSSGWKVFEFFAWLRAKKFSDWMLGTVNID